MEDDPHPDYSEERFWEKLKRHARAAGQPVVEMALQLFYGLQSPETPLWARSVIIGALAYFILPLDAIPDLIPVVGYTDDLGALAAALATVHLYITDDIKLKAKAQVGRWFGDEHDPR